MVNYEGLLSIFLKHNTHKLKTKKTRKRQARQEKGS